MKLFTKIQQANKVKTAPSSRTKHREKFSEFNEWFENFVINTNANGCPFSIRQWFDEVQAKHLDIREELCGVRHTATFDLGPCDIALDPNLANALINQIQAILPYYFTDVGVNREDLLLPNLPSGMRTSKSIMNYASRYDVGSTSIKALSSTVSKLGELWNTCKVDSLQLTSTISTAAKAFCLLGWYGPDQRSCYRTSNASNKFTLGTCKNSFVFLVKSQPTRIHEPEESNTILARMWGFYNHNAKTVNFCNYYPRPTVRQANVLELAKRHAAVILNADPKDLMCFNDSIDKASDVNVYHNRGRHMCPNWTFSTSKEPMGTQILSKE